MKKIDWLIPSWAIIIISVAIGVIPIIGPIIATLHQVQIHLEMFGMYIGGVHIWNSWDWWYLTVLLYAAAAIILPLISE